MIYNCCYTKKYFLTLYLERGGALKDSGITKHQLHNFQK